MFSWKQLVELMDNIYWVKFLKYFLNWHSNSSDYLLINSYYIQVNHCFRSYNKFNSLIFYFFIYFKTFNLPLILFKQANYFFTL